MPTIVALTELAVALGSLLTPLAAIVTAVAGVMIFLSQKKTREAIEKGVAISTANSAVLAVVKEQNDGVISRLGIARDVAQSGEKTALAETATARAETVAATRAGDDRVAEANRSNEAAASAVKEGAQAAIEPIAEKAVVEGTENALSKRDKE